MTKNDIMNDDPQDLQDNPDKYVNLTDLAGDCDGSYEKFAIKCDLIGVNLPSKKEFDEYTVNGGCCSRHIKPLISYLESFNNNNK